ncbi:MAG: YraN family protein [Alphaproteobacteria bacterium]|nr:MAG: YraN family protein [Alphaproteobacteria bacterium]
MPTKKRPSSANKSTHYHRGCVAEDAACAWLCARNYTILARRMRTPYGEIDIIARCNDVVAFIEVKARPSLDDAFHAITPKQRQRIINAALHYLSINPIEVDMRFDVIAINHQHDIMHLPNAWEAT